MTYAAWSFLKACLAASLLFLGAHFPPAKADDFDDCARLSGSAAIEACNRGINSGRYRGRDLGRLYYNRGVEHFASRNAERALDDYTQSIRLDPNYPSAYYNRGIVYRQMNRFDEAIADYTSALRLQESHEFYNNRGVAYERKGDNDRALADYNSAIRLKRDYAIAYYNRANIHSDQGKSDLALKDYNEALRLNPQYSNAYFNRGLLFKKTGQKDKAIDDFRAVLRSIRTTGMRRSSSPNWERDGSAAARQLSHWGHETYGTHFRDRWQVSVCSSGRVRVRRGVHCFRTVPARHRFVLGPNPDEGIPACTRLIAVYTGVNLARTYGTRGHLLNLKGDLEGALRDFNESIRIDPSAGDGWYNRGVIYRKKGLRDLAIADFRRALRINPNDTDAIKNLEALGERP